MNTRAATPKDGEAIFAVHASNGESLPWADAGECRSHVERMIGLGNPPIVAEQAGAVIAEMELWWGQDVPELGESLDVSMLQVHRAHQRRGAGSELIRHALAMAKRLGCDCLSVWAAAEAMDFYRRHGLQERLLIRTFQVAAGSADADETLRFRPATMAALPRPAGGNLLTGRLVHPNQRWHDFADDEANPPAWKGSDQRRRSIFCAVAELPAGKEPVVAVYRLAHWRGDAEQAELYLWAPRRRSVLLAAIAEARGMGIRTLRMHAHGQVAAWLGELGEPVGQDEHILARPVP